MDLFRSNLAVHFHHGHELGLLERVYKETQEQLQAPVTGNND